MASKKAPVEYKPHTTWEASGGMMLLPAGKKKNGKPHTVLAIQVIVCMTKADARALEKHQPSLRFVERTGSTLRQSAAREKT